MAFVKNNFIDDFWTDFPICKMLILQLYINDFLFPRQQQKATAF